MHLQYLLSIFYYVSQGGLVKKKKMKPLMVEHVLGVQMWKRSELTEGLVPGYRGSQIGRSLCYFGKAQSKLYTQ